MSVVKPLITIIIPTFNRAMLLTRAINSVLSQTFENFRLIVLDNMSTDSTSTLLNKLTKLDNRIHYVRHQKNIGAALNFRFGIQKVETEYFSILSDDDFMLPDFLERSLGILTNNKQLGFVCLDTVFVNEDLNILTEPRLEGKTYFREGPSRALFWDSPMTWTSMLFTYPVKDIFLMINVLSDPGFDIAMLRMAAAYLPYAYHSWPGAVFMCHSGSTSTSGFPVSELLNYYVISLNRLASIAVNQQLSTEIRTIVANETSRMVKRGFLSYALPHLYAPVKNFLLTGSLRYRSQLHDFISLLSGFRSPYPMLLRFILFIEPLICHFRPIFRFSAALVHPKTSRRLSSECLEQFHLRQQIYQINEISMRKYSALAGMLSQF